jgi:tetratricopeptide (TPR) repeat protein
VAELTIDQALQQGVEAHKAGQVQEADLLYTAILKAQPKHPDANHNMGVLAVGVGKVQEALQYFKTALEANPATAQFWLSYIDALIKLEKLAEAQTVLDQAKSKGTKFDGFDQLEQRLKEASDEPSAASKKAAEAQAKQPNTLNSLKLDQAISLAKKKAKEGSSDQARRIYQDILTKFPRNKRARDGIKALATNPVGKVSKVQNPPQDQLQSLITLHSQGQLQQALKQAETLVQQFPKSPVLFNIQGVVLKGLGQLDQSIEAYEKALALEPDFAEAYNNIGNVLLKQGKLKEAIEAFNKALAIKPDYAEAYNNMGITLKDQGKLEEALEAYTKALAIKPDFTEACFRMGVVLQEQGKLKEAIEVYKKTLALKPDYAEAYNNMAVILKNKGKLEEALEAYTKALAIKPDFTEACFRMGVVLQEQGKLKEAIEAYKKTLTLKPNYAEAYNNIAVILKDQSKLEEAIEAYNKALALKPDYAEAYNNMGIVLQEQGKLEEAFEAYTKALTIKPDFKAWYNMSITLQEQGKLEEAVGACKKVLAIKPDYTEAYYTMGDVLRAQGKLEEAVAAYKKNSSKKSQIRILKCLYELNEQDRFYNQLDYMINQGENNAVMGSYISRSQIRYGIKRANPFCSDPLKYAYHTNLTNQCDFENSFVKCATDILSKDAVQNRSQSLLTNGIQTTGNVFNQIGNFTDNIKSIICSEIENYRMYFKDNPEGLIKNWPSDYEIYGWLVSMKSGGKLAAHMHDKGWISGSIYINVPPKSKKDSGNLVVTTDEETGKTDNSKSIDVVTGSLCLFPSSLLHYTIPFESDEDRIVLAFDVIPK